MTLNKTDSTSPRKYKKRKEKQKPEKEKNTAIITKDKDDDDSKEMTKDDGKLEKRKNVRKKILYELHHTHDACDNPVKFKSKTHEILKQILNKNHNISYT